MSLDICRQVNADYPQLLTTNIGATCHEFTLKLIERLRVFGHEAYLMCKSPGEGQFVPPGFQPRPVEGLDGNTYTCSGVSHDAIWCDGVQIDSIGQANDGPYPIFNNNGQQIHGVPTWNEVPPQYWRPNNPPLKEGTPPTPQPPMPTQPPGREEALDELNWLDGYYSAPEGLQRPNGLSLNGKPDFEGVAAWYLDVYQRDRMAMMSRADSRADYVNQIRHSDEWKTKHPGETP